MINLTDKIAIALLVLILLLTAGVYSQLYYAEFIGLDDSRYVYGNPHIRDGVSWEGTRWAFSAELIKKSPNADYWRPLTFLSHMVDIELFGMNPTGHHLVSIAIHLFNVVLVYALLRTSTGQPYPSLFVAAVFALHPLQVESVAWVTERKDVLSTCLGLLSLCAYGSYVKQPNWNRYATAIGVFALGLMSKPILMTLPFVMLLMDLWPLRRIQVVQSMAEPNSTTLAGLTLERKRLSQLFQEKIPWFLLAVCSGLITLSADMHKPSLEAMSLQTRMANALVAYVNYLGKIIWPRDLAILYPHHGAPPTWQIIAAIVVLETITIWALRALAQRPYRSVGWFWYLGILVPVIGIIQNGPQSTADRFTYLPIIGVLIIVAWTFHDLHSRWPALRGAFAVLILPVLLALSVSTWKQVGYWKDSISLYSQTLAVTHENPVIENYLGTVLTEKGRYKDAVSHLRRAVRMTPKYANAHYNLGTVLERMGQREDAVSHLRIVVEQEPNFAPARSNLGSFLAQMGQHEEAVEHLLEALRWAPKDAHVHFNLGSVFRQKGNYEKAVQHFRDGLQLRPGDAKAHSSLGDALVKLGQHEEAIVHYRTAIKLKPNLISAINRLAWIYATHPRKNLRNAAEAVRLAEQACQLTKRKRPACLDTLGAAYAEAFRFAEAVRAAQTAINLAESVGDQELATNIRTRLEFYRQERAYRQGADR